MMDVHEMHAMRTIGEADGVGYLVADALGEGFEFALKGPTLAIRPRQAEPFRRTLRPVARFDVETPQGRYPELNLSMGRIVFEAGSSEPRQYRPFSRDPARSLRSLYVGPELPTEDDPDYFCDVCTAHAVGLASDAHPWIQGLPGSPEDRGRRRDRLIYLHHHAHGWFHLVEMDLLDAMVRASARNGTHAVEIGSYQGRSTAVIAAAHDDVGVDSLVIAVDPNALSRQQADMVAANVASVADRRRLVQIQRPAASVSSLFANAIAHVGFIDGSHLYEDVRLDFELCDRLLVPGGVLVFHDVYPAAHLGYDSPRPGPGRVVSEIVLPTGRYRPIAGAHLALALKKLE